MPSMPLQDLPFPRDQVAAAANVNPDYPGTCGRCYEVRWAARGSRGQNCSALGRCFPVKACSMICSPQLSSAVGHHLSLPEHFDYTQLAVSGCGAFTPQLNLQAAATCRCVTGVVVSNGTVPVDIRVSHSAQTSSQHWEMRRPKSACLHCRNGRLLAWRASRKPWAIYYASSTMTTFRMRARPPTQAASALGPHLALLAAASATWPRPCLNHPAALLQDFYYLAGVNSTVQDTYGRSFPGNPLEAHNQQFVRCWNATDNNGTTPSVTVHIIDNCPAVQEKPEGLVSCKRCICRLTRWCSLVCAVSAGYHESPRVCVQTQHMSDLLGSSCIWRLGTSSIWLSAVSWWLPWAPKALCCEAHLGRGPEGEGGKRVWCLGSVEMRRVVHCIAGRPRMR